jgi:hypothetical protein
MWRGGPGSTQGMAEDGSVQLTELLSRVRGSSALDWSVITPIHLGGIEVYGTDAPQVGFRGQHEYLAHYNPDLDISIAWGAEQNRGEPHEGAWSAWSHFPDRRVYGLWVDILWQGSPVHRDLIISADGHRFYLPAPDPVVGEDASDEITRWTVRKSSLVLPRLLNGIQNPHEDTDRRVLSAGFEVVDD